MISTYILCGGKSTRMGEEKGLVMLGDKNFLSWILEAVRPVSDTIHLITKNEKYREFGLPMEADLIAEKGPVGGIYTALAHSKSEWNLILSCDIPRISTSVLQDLISQVNTNSPQMIMVTDGINDYPLIGIYPKSLSRAFLQAIHADKLKLCPLVNSFSPVKYMVRSDRQTDVVNVNTKLELLQLSQNLSL